MERVLRVTLRDLVIKSLSLVLVSAAPIAACSQTISPGDVIAGIGRGQYAIYSNGGVYKGTISSPHDFGYTTGCAFTKDSSKLYTTYFSDDVVKVFDATGTAHPVLKTIDTSSAGDSNESLVFDQAGNWYVGHADGAHGVMKFSPSDELMKTYYPTVEDRGTDWIDLAKDQKTLFYTSEGLHMKRFDISSNTQLADFSGALPGSEGYAHRLLSPFDGSGGLLVAKTEKILRLDKSGNVIKTYTAPGAQIWFALNLDPNGTSFWSGDVGTGKLYRFNIATGAIEVGPIQTKAGSYSLGGICVQGEITPSVDTIPPIIVLDKIVSGPPKQVVLGSHDTQTGLKSLTVLECSNCTAVNEAFTVGTNATVTTTATKTDPSESSAIKLQATDVAGNTTTFDPIDFEITERGAVKEKTVLISPEETKVIIANGTPGIHSFEVTVNGKLLPLVRLKDGGSATIDISKYIAPPTQNRVTIYALGSPHGTAWVVITQP